MLIAASCVSLITFGGQYKLWDFLPYLCMNMIIYCCSSAAMNDVLGAKKFCEVTVNLFGKTREEGGGHRSNTHRAILIVQQCYKIPWLFHGCMGVSLP